LRLSTGTNTTAGRVRRLVLAGTLAMAGSFAIGPTTAQAASATASSICPAGYVCLVPSPGGSVIQVKEGDSRKFAPAVKVSSLANETRLNYCVSGNVNFSLPSGAVLVTPRVTIVSVTPGDVCPL
jgi:hypothetical protein